MAVTRILVVGTRHSDLLEGKRNEVLKGPKAANAFRTRFYYPTSILDYHVCIVDLTKFSIAGLKTILWDFLDDFDDFFNGGGALVVFASRPSTQKRYIKSPNSVVTPRKTAYHSYDWLPVELVVKDKQGESVTFSKKSAVGRVLEDDDFRWDCVFETELRHTVIARNPAGKAVGIEIPLSEGHLILLPAFKGEDTPPELTRSIVDAVKKSYVGETDVMVPRPDWTGEYVLEGEERAIAELTKAKATMDKYEAAKGLLYLYGKRLTKSIRTILEELGYDAKDMENEGRHDIEIEWKGNKGLLEVKGLKKHAGATDLRQLSDHFSQAREDAEEKGVEIEIKGIFVVNNHREKHPEKRGEPFTKEATRIGKRDEFCLMTTTQLHHMYSEFLNGGLSHKEIHRMIWETKGALAYRGVG